MNEQPLKPEMTLAEVTRIAASAVPVFEENGIDYSCHGATSLGEAAAGAGFTVEELSDLIESSPHRPMKQWWQESLPELMRFLIADHAYLTSELFPATRAALNRVEALDDEDRRLVSRIGRIFSDFTFGSGDHIFDEERDLFPTIQNLVTTEKNSETLPPRVSQRVLGELIEHQALSRKLRTMRDLALRIRGEGAADLIAILDRMTHNIHFHMHLENNVLYPRAIEIENRLRRSA